MSGVLFVVTVPKIDFEEGNNPSDLKINNNREDSNKLSAEICEEKSFNFSFDNQSAKSDEGNDDKLADVPKVEIECEVERNINPHRSIKSFTSQLTTVNEIENVKEGCHSEQLKNEDSVDSIPMEKVIKEVLKALKITDAAWSESLEGTHWQVTFSVSGRARSERALRTLRGAGLGGRPQTTLCVLPCALHYKSTLAGLANHLSGEVQDEDEVNQTAWGAFVNSVRARQTVAQVVEQIKSESALTFDFLFLLIIAALVAAIGLVENSTVFLVASMLISPLMGPIMAGTFGTAIRDKELLKMGIKHELLGLFLALIIGFFFGIVICSIDEDYGVGEWPTLEITSRCDLRALWVGALVAVPSGAAVAIAVLSDNTSSLVGVAISASLLPPAVNAGLLWAMSLVHLIFQDDDSKFKKVVKTHVYSDSPIIELAVNGSISLCLTLVNILFIYIAGILVYKIKEVAPTNSTDEQFWKEGIKAVRDYNKTVAEDMKTNMDNRVGENNMETFRRSKYSLFRNDLGSHDLFERLRFMGNTHMTWSPHPAMTRRVSAKELHGYYRQFSEDPAARKPRLSFPVNQLPGYKRLNEDSTSDIFNIVKADSNTSVNSRGSKFTVVPVDETK